MKLKTTRSEKDIVAALVASAQLTLLDGTIRVEVVDNSIKRIELPGGVVIAADYGMSVSLPATKKITHYFSQTELLGKVLTAEYNTDAGRDDWERKIRRELTNGDNIEFVRREEEIEVIDQE